LVAHVDRVQLGDVDTEFHGRPAEQHRQLSVAEPIFPLLALIAVDLGGVLARLEPVEESLVSVQAGRDVPVQLAEEGIVGGANAAVAGVLVIAESPAQGFGIDLPSLAEPITSTRSTMP
jgi:hypothetical protein